MGRILKKILLILCILVIQFYDEFLIVVKAKVVPISDCETEMGEFVTPFQVTS